jgi:hypothetical protein
MPSRTSNKNSRDSGALGRRQLPAKQPSITLVPKPVVKSGVGSVKKSVVSAQKGLRKRKSKSDSVGESKGSSSVKKSPKLSSLHRKRRLALSLSDLREDKNGVSPGVPRLKLPKGGTSKTSKQRHSRSETKDKVPLQHDTNIESQQKLFIEMATCLLIFRRLLRIASLRLVWTSL